MGSMKEPGSSPRVSKGAVAPEMTDDEKLVAAIRLLDRAYEIAKESDVIDLLLPVLNARGLIYLVVNSKS